MKKIWNWSMFIPAVLMIAGCAKVPQEAVDSASVLVEDAQTQEADVYAPEIFGAAQDSFEAAKTEIALQGSKFALTRNYGAAERQLASASRLAREASETGAMRKQQMRVETDSLLAQARVAASEARMLLTKAPKGKEGRIALVAISSDVDSLSGMMTDVEEMLNQGKVKSAHDLAQVTLERARGLTEELQHAIDKTKSGGRRG